MKSSVRHIQLGMGTYIQRGEGKEAPLPFPSNRKRWGMTRDVTSTLWLSLGEESIGKGGVPTTSIPLRSLSKGWETKHGTFSFPSSSVL